MPVWGFADVIASTVDGVAVGERFYGYFPIASHLRVWPERVTARGFYDGAAHRKTLTSAYNQYMRCSADAAYREADENYQMLVRPLFITSFMLADFLQDQAFFGAQQLVFSSASSKTAYGTAFCLQAYPQVQRIALTSARNKDFVAGLGCYGAVAAYDELPQIDPANPRCMSIFQATKTCAVPCTSTLVMPWFMTVMRARRKTRSFCASSTCRGPRRVLFCTGANPQTQCRLGPCRGEPAFQRRATGFYPACE